MQTELQHVASYTDTTDQAQQHSREHSVFIEEEQHAAQVVAASSATESVPLEFRMRSSSLSIAQQQQQQPIEQQAPLKRSSKSLLQIVVPPIGSDKLAQPYEYQIAEQVQQDLQIDWHCIEANVLAVRLQSNLNDGLATSLATVLLASQGANVIQTSNKLRTVVKWFGMKNSNFIFV